MDARINPDLPDWMQDHLRRYLETRGEDGHICADVFRARARTAGGEERERLWRVTRETWPQFDDSQTATERQIPVVVLERV